MIRITTNGVLRSYKSSLMRNANNLNSARDKVLTQRNFNSFAEDPASATQAFQLRRAASRVRDQHDTSTGLTKKYEQAFQTMESIIDDLGGQTKDAILSALSDDKGDARKQLGSTLLALSKSMIQDMNAQYGDTFTFAGADGMNVPFTWGDNGELLFRGIDVNTTDPDELKKLQLMSKEAVYVDVGFGLQEDGTDQIIPASAFNSAISGIKFLGFGMKDNDPDGVPNNLASLVKELGTIFSRCEEGGNWAPNSNDEARAKELNTQFRDVISRMIGDHAELDVQAKSLKNNTTRLYDTHEALNEQFLEIEQVDLADAISSFSWAQYCYNSALKVGNSILSQSLLDYMN